MSTESHYNNVSSKKTVRSDTILTTNYVVGTVIDTEWRFNQLILLVTFTLGSLDSGEIKVEFSNDNSTYYRETVSSTTGGETTLSANNYTWTDDVNLSIAIPIKYRYIKVSAQGTGTVTGSSMGIEAYLGNI